MIVFGISYLESEEEVYYKSIDFRAYLWARILELNGEDKVLIVFSLSLKNNVSAKWFARVKFSWGSPSKKKTIKAFDLNNDNSSKSWSCKFLSSNTTFDSNKHVEPKIFITIDFYKRSNLFGCLNKF